MSNNNTDAAPIPSTVTFKDINLLPVDRIRGGSIRVQVECFFSVTLSSGKSTTLRVPGIVFVEQETEVPAAIPLAVENARANLRILLSETHILTGSSANSVLRTLFTKNVPDILAKSPEKEKELMALATNAMQKRVNDVFELLGIDPIQVEGIWTVAETAALLQEMNRITTQMTLIAE